MSNRVLFAAVLVTVALLGLALMLNRQPSPASGSGTSAPALGPAGATRLLMFEPKDVSSITIRHSDGREETVQRSVAGRWMYSQTSTTRVGRTTEWPAAIPGVAAGAISALANLETPVAPNNAAFPAGGPTLAIRAGAVTHNIRISPEPLGGKTLVQIGPGPGALVDSSLIEPFLKPGPSSWRIGSALPGVRDAARLTITTQSDSLALARVEGRWTLRRPISTRAAEASVTKLFDALDQIAITRFVDDARPDLGALGLDRPRLMVQTETDERSIDAEAAAPGVRVHRAELYVGAPANADGSQLYASPDPNASLVFVIPAAALGQISTAPRNYIATAATGVLPAGVFALTIRHTDPAPFDRGYRRELGQWRSMSGGGRTTAQREPPDASRINELLDFLSARPGEPEPIAELTSGSPPPPSIRVLARIELANQEGDPLDVLNIGYTAEGVFAVRSGGVLLLYPRAAPPAILELPEFASLPSAPGGPSAPTGTERPPIK